MEKEPQKPDPRAELLAELKRLRQDYSDDIPQDAVSSVNGAQRKISDAWFGLVSGNLEMAVLRGLFSEDLAKKQEEFADQFCNLEFSERLTTKEDIDTANTLLDEAIAELEPE
ncbi:hypothetical protein KJ713_00215 [Patescibacteria group bacterium]|nr:hypothetical protein [Patescibacteria group bacterium]